MEFRRLTEEEKFDLARFLPPERMEIFGGDPAAAAFADIVGGFGETGDIELFYWLYGYNANTAYISYGITGHMTRELFGHIRHVIEWLCEERTILGEISESNRVSLKIADRLGCSVAGRIPGAEADGSARIIIMFPKKGVNHG